MSEQIDTKNVTVKSEPTNDINQPEVTNVKQEPTIETTAATTATETTAAPSVGRAKSPRAAASATRGSRSFVPNLGVRRADVKKEVVSEPKDTKEKKPRRQITPNLGARGGRGGRGGRNQPNLVQTDSIFGAGPAESTKRFGNERNAADSYSKVVGINSGSGSGGGTSHSGSNLKNEPFDESRMKIEQNLLIEDLKDQDDTIYVKLKNENKENDNENKNEATEVVETKTEIRDKKNLINLFNPEEEDRNKEKLVMFQLPENLELYKLGEGHIGKIKVYKSGKILLCLNDENYMNVTLSVSGAFLQDAVALDNVENISESSNPIHMKNMGHISHKVICSPKLF